MRVIVFYGTDCNERTAWIPWLKNELEMRGGTCLIPNLPTPKNQTFKTWENIANDISIDKEDIVVAWSTGAIFSVRYLFEHNIKIHKLILISGFNNYVGNVPFVDNINKDFFMNDIKVARSIANEIVCIKSNNDPFITQVALNSFAENLNAKIINIENGGHFIAMPDLINFLYYSTKFNLKMTCFVLKSTTLKKTDKNNIRLFSSLELTIVWSSWEENHISNV